jgi:hypothetical protein
MASGHVNRTNRPNTWLHRPATQREDFPCQLGAVHTWHLADMPKLPAHLRFRGVSSIGQCNTSCSLLAGVSKAKVFRGR